MKQPVGFSKDQLKQNMRLDFSNTNKVRIRKRYRYPASRAHDVVPSTEKKGVLAGSLERASEQMKPVSSCINQHIREEPSKPLYIVRKAVAHVRDQPKKSTYCVQLMKNKEIGK